MLCDHAKKIRQNLKIQPSSGDFLSRDTKLVKIFIFSFSNIKAHEDSAIRMWGHPFLCVTHQHRRYNQLLHWTKGPQISNMVPKSQNPTIFTHSRSFKVFFHQFIFGPTCQQVNIMVMSLMDRSQVRVFAAKCHEILGSTKWKSDDKCAPIVFT